MVDSKKSFWRSTETERGYASIRGQMNSLAQRYSVVQFIMDRYNRPNSEPFLDYFELARQLNIEVNRLNQQRGIH